MHTHYPIHTTPPSSNMETQDATTGVVSHTPKINKKKALGLLVTCITPILYRVVSPRLLNAESEERMFGTLKDITRHTSSMRPGEIEFNALIRLLEELQQQSSRSYDHVVSKHAAHQHTAVNTIIVKKRGMKKISHHWQALLENI